MAYRAHKRGDINEHTKDSLYNYGTIFCKITNPKDSSTKEELYDLVKSYNGRIVKEKYILDVIAQMKYL